MNISVSKYRELCPGRLEPLRDCISELHAAVSALDPVYRRSVLSIKPNEETGCTEFSEARTYRPDCIGQSEHALELRGAERATILFETEDDELPDCFRVLQAFNDFIHRHHARAVVESRGFGIDRRGFHAVFSDALRSTRSKYVLIRANATGRFPLNAMLIVVGVLSSSFAMRV